MMRFIACTDMTGTAYLTWTWMLLTAGIPALAEERPGIVKRTAAWFAPGLNELTAEMAKLDVATLPAPAGANSGNRLGFQSAATPADQDLWIELEFPQPITANRVVLVPAVIKDTQGTMGGFGFPRRFVLEGIDGEGETHVLLDASGRRFPNPGFHPVNAPCPAGVAFSRIRLTATRPWELDGLRTLSLAEILVLDGNLNRAPEAKITSVNSRESPPTWGRANLVDMVMPVGLPIRPDGSPKLGWHSSAGTAMEEPKQVAIDLGTSLPLEEIRLIPAWRDKVFGWNNYGLPARFKIEASSSGDFSDAWTVYDRTSNSLQSPGQNIQCYTAGGRPARHVRITATRLRERTGEYVFALGELQIYSAGVNRAAGAPVITGESLENDEWSRTALTDGRSGGGVLLELPDWFDALDRNRELQQRRDQIQQQSVGIIARAEQAVVTASLGGAAGIVLMAGALSWRGQRRRRQEREQHRERLARDLHDELGSNLGSIALISSFAGQEGEEQMRVDLATIERVARESADSMRDMVALLGGNKRGGTGDDWLRVMNGLAERLLRGVDLECRLPSTPLVWEPNLETRREIYLFCKEVLHNAARHARPPRVRFHLGPTAGGVRVEIEDNGCGFDPVRVAMGHGLGNLRERAGIMKATMTLTSSPGKGTTVTLDIPRSRRWSRN